MVSVHEPHGTAEYRKEHIREVNHLDMKFITLHNSGQLKILNVNLKAGALLPIHSHDVEDS